MAVVMLMKIVSLSPFVKVKFILNMFIGLWFLIVLCQCDQVNEKAKNYGEKFDVSVAQFLICTQFISCIINDAAGAADAIDLSGIDVNAVS